VAQLGGGTAVFWVAPASSTMRRLSPRQIDGATGRTLMVVSDPDSVVRQRWPAAPRSVRSCKTSTAGGSADHRWFRTRVGDRHAARNLAPDPGTPLRVVTARIFALHTVPRPSNAERTRSADDPQRRV
jgi:hypothetical protein